jgi:1,4-alpha-glucan branching enzyme
MPEKPLDPQTVIDIDGYLKPNVPAIVQRHDFFRYWKDRIDEDEGGYDKFTMGYHKMGFNVMPDGEVVYREWAPNAKEANLIGDFNKWNRISHPMKKDQYGVWEIRVPPVSPGVCAIPHDSKVKVHFGGVEGEQA